MYRFFKRFFDIFFSLLAIILLSPVFIIMFILVGCINGFPVIFKQPRPGKNGKIFMMYKFRSMTNKKDEKGNLLPDSQRITKFGTFIRKTSLDEIPQFWNVLKGDMSFIGPRPKLIKDVLFFPEYTKTLDVRPGITGLAQANERTNNTWESVFVYNDIYVEKMSLKMDVQIIFKTIGTVLKHTGVNDGTTDVQDYYYPDYLLRVGRITQDEYDAGIQKAKRIEKEFISSRQFRKGFVLKPSYKEQEDFDLQERNVD